jgi:succinoglycan biosynthesis transport protein ExoP
MPGMVAIPAGIYGESQSMSQEEIGLQHYVEVLWRRKWVILSIFSIVFSLCVVWISMSKTSYSVFSLVAIKNPLYYRQAQLGFAPGATGPDQSLHGESYVQIINGLPFSEKVANALASLPEPVPADPHEVYASLNAEFQEPDLLKIHAQHIDADRAIVIANAAAETFEAESLATLKAQIVSYAEYARTQMEQYQTEMRRADGEITKFKEGLGFVNLNDEILTLKSTIGEFEKEAASVQTQIEVATAHRAEIISLAKVTKDGSLLVDEPQVENLRKLQDMLTEARLHYTKKHPTIRNLEGQIISIEGKLRRSLESSGSSLSPERYLSLRDELQQTEALLADLKTASNSWARQIAKVRSRMGDFPEKQYELEVLQAAAVEAKAQHSSWRAKVDQANSEAATVQGNAKIIDLARSARPAVRKSTNVALAFIVSLMLALGVAFVTEFADSTIRTPEEVTRAVGLGFLGSIIRLKDPKQLVFSADAKGTNSIAEAYTRIYSNIKFAAVEGPLRSILVTSARKGEGKSTTMINLACAMAASGKRVIVVDTDLRNPTLQRILGTKHQTGATNVLAGEMSLDEVLQPTAHPGVTILPSGPIPPNPAELVQSGAMKEMIADLEVRSDLVVFDSPPALLVADAMLLGSELDAAIIVSESGGVTRKEVQHVRDTLQVAKARILGVILNKVAESPGSYYYNYYSYYRYYQESDEPVAESTGAIGWLKDSVKAINSRISGRT